MAPDITIYERLETSAKAPAARRDDVLVELALSGELVRGARESVLGSTLQRAPQEQQRRWSFCGGLLEWGMRVCKVVRLGGRFLQRIVLCIMGSIAVLKLGPMVTMTLSMLLSLAVYALTFGAKFAVGFVIILGLHELGHLIASRVVGLGVFPPVFIPFIGAIIRLKHSPKNAKMEANVAIGGPAMGTISALAFLALHFWTESLLMLVLAYTACLLNLFNLVPCDPLDGGRIAVAITPRLWWVGSFVMAGLFLFTSNFFIFVIFVFSLLRLWSHEENDENRYYYQLTPSQRIAVMVWYLGLLTVLGVATLYIMHMLR